MVGMCFRRNANISLRVANAEIVRLSQRMMKPKYVICPGVVQSSTDGQRHYINPMQLMRLYGLDPRECEIHDPAPWWPESYYRMAAERQRGLPRLGPRYDGNYKVPNDKGN